jgi:hypothetical protein
MLHWLEDAAAVELSKQSKAMKESTLVNPGNKKKLRRRT